jgi:Ca2+/Na+ antiporter
VIGEGSELLLLTPYAPLIGAVILPFLGAVPDGMMVLFSGLGKPTAEAQESLKVGIGALAGSSILALTLAFGVMILAGRVDLDNNGYAIYSKKNKITNDFFQTGISVEP